MKYSLQLLFLFISAFLQAQFDCSNDRYKKDIFTNVQVTKAIKFGSNRKVSANPFAGDQDLYLDVYEPVGDNLAERPLIILAFGGGFVEGKREDVDFLCVGFAKKGYVAVAIDYRIGTFLPTKTNVISAVIRGMHDMKAALRYLFLHVNLLRERHLALSKVCRQLLH